MSDHIVQLMKAADFAARKHEKQKRKGELAEPYVNHVLEVARLVAEATGGADPVPVIAALLHDTIEDTGVKPEELEAEFGAEVAAIVAEVTDDKSKPKELRKQLQVDTAARKSHRAKLVKIADKLSNLTSLVNSPPADWSHTRKREYVKWAAEVVDRCRGVNPWLEARFDEAHRTARGRLQ